MTTNLPILSAFDTAHKDFEKGLKAYAFFKVSDRDACDDLVQDTFMKTWSYLARGGKIYIMKAFLYHVLNNLIIDQYRKRKCFSLDVICEAGFEPASEDHAHLVDELDGRSATLIIATMAEKYRSALSMRYIEHLTLSEMALKSGKTKNMLAVHIHRGLEKLKMLYEGPISRVATLTNQPI